MLYRCEIENQMSVVYPISAAKHNKTKQNKTKEKKKKENQNRPVPNLVPNNDCLVSVSALRPEGNPSDEFANRRSYHVAETLFSK